MIISFVFLSRHGKYSLNNYASFKQKYISSALFVSYFAMPIRTKGNAKRCPDVGRFF